MPNRAWYVTPLLAPDRKLDGPYATRDLALTACLKRSDPISAIRALAAGRIVATYVPRMFDAQEREVAHLKSHVGAPAGAPSPRGVGSLRDPLRGGTMLPEVAFSYPRGGLLTLCRALHLPDPPRGVDRAAILAHIERELQHLADKR